MSWGQLLGSIGGTWADTSGQKRAFRSNMKWNKHVFAANEMYRQDMKKNAIQYRVQDARNAGLHPLAALGMSTGASSPISVGSTPTFSSNMGQDLARAGAAVDSILDRKTRNINISIAKEDLRNRQLQNDLLQKQINDANKNPPLPDVYPHNNSLPGQTNAIPGVTIKPDEQIHSTQAGVTSGSHAEESWVVDKHGVWKRGLSKDRAESMESDAMANIGYQIGKAIGAIDNYGTWTDQTYSSRYKFADKIRKFRPHPKNAPPGKEFRWSFKHNGWMLVNKNGSSRFYVDKKWQKVPFNKKPRTHGGKFNWRYK